MATHVGNGGTVMVGAAEVAEIQSYTYTRTHEPAEDTSMGDTYKTHKPGISAWTFGIECSWDEEDTTGQGAMTAGAEVTMNFHPEGAVSGDIYETGDALITEVGVAVNREGVVTQSFSGIGNGALTESVVV